MSAYGWDAQQPPELLHPQRYVAATDEDDDDDEDEPLQRRVRPDGKGGKRSRQTYSKYQTAVLETVFRTSKYIVRSKRQQMSAELNLTERQIKIWFQNRRMKEKKCRKDAPRDDDPAGYADDYATTGYPLQPPQPPPTNNNDDAFMYADYHQRHVASKPAQHPDGGVGYSDFGYDLQQLTSPDPYATCKHEDNGQQWPDVGFHHQDYYGDHDLNRFQRPPTTHHHHLHQVHPLNPQGPDYNCPTQLLQAAHGY